MGSNVNSWTVANEGESVEFYSKKYRCIFYHSTKCGMTTLISALKCYLTPARSIPKDVKVMCVIRDPETRFISGFFHLRKIGMRKGYAFRYLKPEFWKRLRDGGVVEAFRMYHDEIVENGPFDSHNMQQSCFLNGDPHQVGHKFPKRDVRKITHFIRFEHLGADLTRLFPNLRIKYMNRGGASTKEVAQCRSLIDLNKFKKIYKKDYELFRSLNQNSSTLSPSW